jgi:hypothetical protein
MVFADVSPPRDSRKVREPWQNVRCQDINIETLPLSPLIAFGRLIGEYSGRPSAAYCRHIGRFGAVIGRSYQVRKTERELVRL